jgi:hypothetical protein
MGGAEVDDEPDVSTPVAQSVAGTKRNPAGAVYGAITVGALLAAESPRRETYVETVAAVLVAVTLYWLAHAYAALLGRRVQAGHRLTGPALRDSLLHEFPILAGAVLPLAALLIGWLGGASLSDSAVIAVWTSAATIVAIEVAAGVRARLATLQLIGQTFVGAAFGLAIILLRVILH